MKIEILGTGCKNCEALERATATALEHMGIDVPIERVTDYGEIAAHGVMSTPALVIDGRVRTIGRVPSVSDLIEIIGADTV